MDRVSIHGQSSDVSSGVTILLVDDNPEIGRAVRIAFEVAGHRLDVAGTPEEAFSRLASARYDAVLLDLNFAPGKTGGDEGLACLDRIIADDPAACIVIITAHSGIRVAVAAMQAGARDFVMKPWRNSELIGKVEAAIARTAPQSRSASLLQERVDEPASLLGDSPAMARVRNLVRRLGPTEAGVAITGRSGSGRKLVARALHAASASATQPSSSIDLRDPAQWTRLDGAAGIVMLRHPDQLDDLAQARLLDRLPLAARPIAIADTLHGLGAALRGRIATVEIAVPPLSAREADAVLLARHFVRVSAERHGLPVPHLTPAAERLVFETTWPHEVRGLALAIERAVLLATYSMIDAAALAPISDGATPLATSAAFDLADNERAVIAAALREHHHNVSQAAVALGLSRGALYRRMERYGL